MTTDHEARATTLLFLHLVTRYELAPEEAVLAIEQTRRGETGPHTRLVTVAATAIVREAAAPMRTLFDALLPLAEAAARAMADLARALAPVVQQLHARDRPPWVSPYGPPPRRRFR
jgi:hypothetical protein